MVLSKTRATIADYQREGRRAGKLWTEWLIDQWKASLGKDTCEVRPEHFVTEYLPTMNENMQATFNSSWEQIFAFNDAANAEVKQRLDRFLARAKTARNPIELLRVR